MQNLLFVTVLFLASCSSIPKIPKLELPPKVDCPKPTDKELTLLSPTTYSKIVSLYLSCVENDKTLRNIIRSTH